MLDVNTPRGRRAEEMIRETIIKLETDNRKFFWFPNSNHFQIDGFITSDQKITGIFEGKFRHAGIKDNLLLFQDKTYSEYLITAQKIDDGVSLAKKMCIDYFLMVGLSLSNSVIVFKIFDYATGSIIPHERRNTRTRKTINGGSVIRENAYINLSNSTIITYD